MTSSRSQTKKLLLISGTSSLGQPIISRAQDAGFDVVATYRSGPRDSDQQGVQWLQLDFSDVKSTILFLEAVDGFIFHRIIVLTGQLSGQDILSTDLDSIRHYVSTHLSNPVFVISNLTKALCDVGGILVLTSRSARNASFDALYAMIKGGLQSFALSLALRMAEQQSIVCIAPSLIKDSTMYSAMSEETHSRHLARAHGKFLDISVVADFIWAANPDFCRSLNGRTLEIGHEI